MSDLETINNFIKQLPNVINAFNGVKELCKKDVVKENGLDKKEDMSGKTNEEKRAILEKKYDKLQEIQENINKDIEHRNK